MKIIVAFLAAISLVLVVACSGGEEDFLGQDPSSGVGENPVENSPDAQISAGGVVLTEQGAYHDAIDNTPAADPIQRDEAYMAVAKALSTPYLTEAVGPLDYTMRFETGDYADFVVTGIFSDPTGEGEKEAYFTISRKTSEYWILDDPVIPSFTTAERNYRWNLEKIEEYTDALELFEIITPTLISAVPDYDRTTTPISLTRIFVVEVDNPTSMPRQVRIQVEWEEKSSNPRCVSSEKESKLADIEASATTLVDIEEWSWSGRCPDITFANTQVWISWIDNYEKDSTKEKLEKLQSQTSPP